MAPSCDSAESTGAISWNLATAQRKGLEPFAGDSLGVQGLTRAKAEWGKGIAPLN